ncbi:enolase 4 [Carcharodon carcharias]|uniref:enolase 4 n=1 Tax=Carcharodon carcharias TaxID=13397 RepID=UPI001B7F144E|nr:enolase 4 [Carcharodon carcharias]
MSAGRGPTSNSRSPEQARDFYQLKQRAAEYYRSNSVPQRMQQILNTMFYDKPDDVYGHLANYFANFAKPAAISRIVGKEKLDAEGQRTVEVEVLCTIKNFEKPNSYPLKSTKHPELFNEKYLASSMRFQVAIEPHVVEVQSLSNIAQLNKSVTKMLITGIKLPETHCVMIFGITTITSVNHFPCISRVQGPIITILDLLFALILKLAKSETIFRPPITSFSVCFTTMSNCCRDPNYATQDIMDKENELKNLSVQIALEWINEPLNSLLKGLLPANQTQVDKLLSEYFQRKLEEDEEHRKKDAEVEEITEPDLSISTITAPTVDKKKKSLKAKKSITPEKPIKPREPQEPLFLGSLAIGVVSLAVAKAAARLQNTSLYLHIASLNQEEPPKEMRMPLPMVSLLSCGKSSGGKLKLMKEVIAVPKPNLSYKQSLKMMMALQQQISKWTFTQKSGPIAMSHLGCWEKGFDHIEQPFEVIQEACNALELTLGEDLHLMLNCAAHELMDYEKEKYEIIIGVLKHPDEMIELYTGLVEKYPSIIGLIDPLRKEDEGQWCKLCYLLSPQCYFLADAASRSIDKLITDGLGENRYSGSILKHTNQTTISNFVQVAKLMEAQECRFIPGLTDVETIDDSIADIAVGLGARFIKLGGLCHGERVAKYNRLLAIEEELAQRGALGCAAEHRFPVISEEEPDPDSLDVDEGLDILLEFLDEIYKMIYKMPKRHGQNLIDHEKQMIIP